eukprot:scaffold1194_cov127-Cylindrotheca_fusiformis.AAC.30
MLVNLFVPALALSLAVLVTSEYEVPTKKAMPPKMDPIPTLPTVTHRVFLDIQIDGENAGRITLGLFGEIAPKAVENFVALCNCDKGRAKLTGKDLCYRGTRIHRVIPNFMFQASIFSSAGGDITHGDGTGGESIYGAPFEDESFEVRFNRKYMLSMATQKNSNGSQFFINTVKTQWLTEIEKTGTFGGEPTADVVIVDAGSTELQLRDKTPYLVSAKLEY